MAQSATGLKDRILRRFPTPDLAGLALLSLNAWLSSRKVLRARPRSRCAILSLI
jgi:hypothetical protein